jgi:hypothetical protein
MNNIGGIIRCEIISANDISGFAVVDRTAEIKIKESASWSELPISVKQTSASATPTAGSAGTLYEHKFSSLLPADKVTVQKVGQYRSLCIGGCIVRYTDANGNRRILGTKDYPLTGTLAEVPGSTAASLAGYELNMKASELTPQLLER